jgi:hypothetical protein
MAVRRPSPVERSVDRGKSEDANSSEGTGRGRDKKKKTKKEAVTEAEATDRMEVRDGNLPHFCRIFSSGFLMQQPKSPSFMPFFCLSSNIFYSCKRRATKENTRQADKNPTSSFRSR